jgi:aminopeptidase YwaD
VTPDAYARKAQVYLDTLCSVQPNRRTGSAGNREATDFFARTIRPWGYAVDVAPFACLDYVRGGVRLAHGDQAFEVTISPYSLGCDLQAELIAVSTVEELARVQCRGKILLMTGEICSEQLMPKNFVFYNPDHHQRILALLEEKAPRAIVTATEKKPEQVGALYPFPLIVDGDFHIPNVHCTDVVGEVLAAMRGEEFHLTVDARRVPSLANNVVARLNPEGAEKIVITAHIDAYEDSPGASDNASGTAVLLLAADMLADYPGDRCVEIAALNGEDHYSAGGQMDYLRRYGNESGRVALAVNVDDVGYREGRSAYSFYACPPELERRAASILQEFPGLVRGEPWFSGDHMIFVQGGVPALAFTSERMPELMKTVTHTPLDTPQLVAPAKLVEVARALDRLIRSL